MGRIGITYEDVAKAAHQLQGKGQNSTVDNIRSILGTGSKSTIAAHLRAWKSQQGIIQASDSAIPSELLSLVKGLWERLRETADNQINEYRSEFDAKAKKTQGELNQFQQQNTALLAQTHSLEEKLHQQREATDQQQNILIAEQQEKEKMSERASALESRQQERQAEIERLHQLLRQVQNNLEHYQKASQELRQEQSLLIEKQRCEYEQKITQFQQQIASLTTEKSQYQTEYKHIDKLYKSLQKELQTSNSLKEKIQKQYELLTITYQSLQSEHKNLIHQYQQQSEKLEINVQTVIEAQVTTQANADKIISLEKALAKADNKIQTLRHDYEFASQEKANLAGQIKQLEAAMPRTK